MTAVNVTPSNGSALREAAMAVALVRTSSLELPAGLVDRDLAAALERFSWHTATVVPLDELENGERLVSLAGVALTDELVIVLAGRALNRATARLATDPDVPTELVASLARIQVELTVLANRRNLERLKMVKGAAKVAGL